MSTSVPYTHNQALVIEPNSDLIKPYEYLAPTYEEHRVSSVSETESFLAAIVPDLVLISASFPPGVSVDLLGMIKKNNSAAITPVIFVVDLTHKLNFIPAIFWDNKLAVLDSCVSEDVFVLTMSRLTDWTPY